MMQIANRTLFILVEGEPNSPELFFFNAVIPKIVDKTGWSVQPQVIEVGGSSSFKTVARICYNSSSDIHKTIPVLAIADSDYRIQSSKKQDDNSQLIKDLRPKILYWPRHEWENYLLEETKWLADWVNQIPIKPTQNQHRPATVKKSYKVSAAPADHQQLENFLDHYFRQVLPTEFWECLKFNLAINIKDYPSVKKPADFNTKTFSEIKQWFELQAAKSETVVTLKPKSDTLFDDLMKELSWGDCLNSPRLVDLKLAKQRFRGKEAFVALCQFMEQEFKIHNFDKTFLTRELLTNLANQDSAAIFQDLQNLLSPELRRITTDPDKFGGAVIGRRGEYQATE